MSNDELLSNARECASDALVLLKAIADLSDASMKREMASKAYGLLKVGSEEVSQLHSSLKAEADKA